MKSSLVFILIDLIIFVNSFGATNNRLKKHNNLMEIETYRFKESENYKQDFGEIIHSCTNCRIIVDNKFLYSKQKFKTKKFEKKSKLYCATDRLFNEHSMHACSWSSENIVYQNYSLITIDLTITTQAFINISFLNLNSNMSKTDYEFLKPYFSLGFSSVYSYVKLDIKGAHINNDAKYNLELMKTNASHMYYPFNPIRMGFSLLNHQLCRTQYKSDRLQCQYPRMRTLYMGYFDVNKYMRIARIFDVVMSGIFMSCFLFLFIKCMMFLSSSEICKHIQKKFFHLSITIYSSFFALTLCIDILLSYCIENKSKRLISFLINFFWITIINYFIICGINAIVKCWHEIASNKRNLAKKLALQDTIFHLLNIISVVICITIEFQNNGYVYKSPYSIHIHTIKEYILPIFLLYIVCYTCLSIFSGLSIYALFIKKIRVYRFKDYTFTPDVIGLLHLLFHSFICVIELSLSIFFYVLSSKQIWCWESSVFLFMSVLLFIAYVLSLSFGFNYLLSKYIYHAILGIFDTAYIPFSTLAERPPAYPTNASKTMKSEEIHDFINEFTYEEDDKPPIDDKTDIYYESFIDLVPVFQCSSIKSAHSNISQKSSPYTHPNKKSVLSMNNWKSSGMSALAIKDDDLSVTFPQTSSNQLESTRNNTSEMIMPSISESFASCINNTIVHLQPCKTTQAAESIYSTPDMPSKIHKQYPRTPFKVVCPNINPFLDEVVLKLDFDESKSSI